MPRRRDVVRTVGSATVATLPLCGCLEEGAEARTGTATDTPDTGGGNPAANAVERVTFDRVDCDEREVSFASFEADEFRATGCLVGVNGCRVAALRTVTATPEGLRVSVGVDSVPPSESPHDCPRSYVRTGYELAIRFSDPPTSVELVHEDGIGRETVATVDRS